MTEELIWMVRASQIVCFYDEIKVGDSVLTYNSGQSLYFVGKIASKVKLTSHELFRSRDVNWTDQIARGALKQSTRNPWVQFPHYSWCRTKQLPT